MVSSDILSVEGTRFTESLSELFIIESQPITFNSFSPLMLAGNRTSCSMHFEKPDINNIPKITS